MPDIIVTIDDIDDSVLARAERKARSEGRDLNEVIVGMIATFVSRTEDAKDVEDAKPPERGSG